MILSSMQSWYEENVLRPREEARKRREDAARALALQPVVYTPASPEELAAIAALGKCSYCCGTASKRFARDMQGRTELSARQRAFVWGNVWRFRRQIADKSLVDKAARFLDSIPDSKTPETAGTGLHPTPSDGSASGANGDNTAPTNTVFFVGIESGDTSTADANAAGVHEGPDSKPERFFEKPALPRPARSPSPSPRGDSPTPAAPAGGGGGHVL
jgi:hypothetical protein